MSEIIRIDGGWAELYVRDDGSVLLESNTALGAGLWEHRYDFLTGSAPLISSILGVAPDDCRQCIVGLITDAGSVDPLLERLAAGGLTPVESREYFN